MKQTVKYEQMQKYKEDVHLNTPSQQDQSLVTFDIAASVEKELLVKKEINRKARNKRKANKHG